METPTLEEVGLPGRGAEIVFLGPFRKGVGTLDTAAEVEGFGVDDDDPLNVHELNVGIGFVDHLEGVLEPVHGQIGDALGMGRGIGVAVVHADALPVHADRVEEDVRVLKGEGAAGQAENVVLHGGFQGLHVGEIRDP